MNRGGEKSYRYNREVCEMLDITGERTRAIFSGHALRATSTTDSFEAGLEAESIALVTGY